MQEKLEKYHFCVSAVCRKDQKETKTPKILYFSSKKKGKQKVCFFHSSSLFHCAKQKSAKWLAEKCQIVK